MFLRGFRTFASQFLKKQSSNETDSIYLVVRILFMQGFLCSVYLSSGMSKLKFKFMHSAIQDRSPGEIKEHYGEMVSSLLHHIFFNTTLFDDYGEICIVVDDENTHAHVADRTIYRLELIIHQDDLTLERLRSLLTTN